jgi:hypothetical protein
VGESNGFILGLAGDQKSQPKRSGKQYVRGLRMAAVGQEQSLANGYFRAMDSDFSITAGAICGSLNS